MTAVKAAPAALTDTSASSPIASLGTNASETETVTFIWSPPLMTARGALLEIMLPSTAFIVAKVPEMGAMRPLLAFWMPASSWASVEFRLATAV